MEMKKSTLIGIPKEIKDNEFRVGATPSMVRSMILEGHKVAVETNAGAKIGFTDEMYTQAGAKIVKNAQEVYDNELILKVKEPQKSEFPLLKKGQVLFCYLHLAPDPEQAKHLIAKEVVAIAYETIEDDRRRLPLLTPMSEIAGRISVQVGATYLQIANGGKGVLLGGVPGVRPGKVVVLGAGVSGTEAMRMALGLGAEVVVFDRDLNRLRELDKLYAPALRTAYSTPALIEEEIRNADLVVGAVLIPGKTAPKLLTKKMLGLMQPKSVLVDISIDQGGCFETSRPTTHSNPTYVVDDITHYCVTNMPAACARTSTQALTNATFPYAMKLANSGYKIMKDDPLFLKGLTVHYGKITCKEVAVDLGYEYVPPEKVL
jgi:alanine dehydrogenase